MATRKCISKLTKNLFGRTFLNSGQQLAVSLLSDVIQKPSCSRIELIIYEPSSTLQPHNSSKNEENERCFCLRQCAKRKFTSHSRPLSAHLFKTEAPKERSRAVAENVVPRIHIHRHLYHLLTAHLFLNRMQRTSPFPRQSARARRMVKPS
jgi:hypothetical protein